MFKDLQQLIEFNSILGKLGFATRAQVAAWATRRGVAAPGAD